MEIWSDEGCKNTLNFGMQDEPRCIQCGEIVEDEQSIQCTVCGGECHLDCRCGCEECVPCCPHTHLAIVHSGNKLQDDNELESNQFFDALRPLQRKLFKPGQEEEETTTEQVAKTVNDKILNMIKQAEKRKTG